MQITFINTDRALLTVIVFGIALASYYILVRPYVRNIPAFKGAYDQADTYWQKVFAWIKLRWDIVTAGVLAVLPILWNGSLDLIIALSLALVDIIPALSGLDLSELLMPSWLKTTIQVGGAIIPVIRSRVVKKDDEP